jgi:hypothetical protein
MDITGVGHFFSKELEGARVIELIKERAPTPYTVIYSAAPFKPADPRFRLMRQHADAELDKQEELVRHIESIDQWTRKYFSGSTLVRQMAVHAKMDPGRMYDKNSTLLGSESTEGLRMGDNNGSIPGEQCNEGVAVAFDDVWPQHSESRIE